jgi:hypothetical protein
MKTAQMHPMFGASGEARSLLDSTAMQLHGIPFALAVYNKARRRGWQNKKV